MELRYAFDKLGIANESALMAFTEPSFYRPYLPLDEKSLMTIDEDTELLESSFLPYTVVLICKIAMVLAVAIYFSISASSVNSLIASIPYCTTAPSVLSAGHTSILA